MRPNSSTICATRRGNAGLRPGRREPAQLGAQRAFDPLRRDTRIVVLLEIRDDDVGSLARERDRDRAADARCRRR